eukprot:6211376-Pleurochrysis_carterae.AAC.3
MPVSAIGASRLTEGQTSACTAELVILTMSTLDVRRSALLRETDESKTFVCRFRLQAAPPSASTSWALGR